MVKILKYGGDNTIHKNGELDISVDKNGKVVAVWFRCIMLPFKQVDVDDIRANSLKEVEAPYKIDSIDLIKEK